MKRYKGRKSNCFVNFFSNCKMLEQNKKELEKQYNNTKKILLEMEKNGGSLNDISAMKDQFYETRLKLDKATKKCKNKNKIISRLVVSLGLAATVLTATNLQKANSNLYKDFSEAYSYTQEENTTNFSDISYLSFKNDLKQYITLSNKEKLSNIEKEELENVKTRIQASPEEINKYATEILKKMIAAKLGIDDYNRIEINDKSTQVNTDINNLEKGFIQKIDIKIDGKIKYSNESFQSLMSGEVNIISDTIPKEILNAINQIVISQEDPQNLKLAVKALETTLDLESKNWSFEQSEKERD